METGYRYQRAIGLLLTFWLWLFPFSFMGQSVVVNGQKTASVKSLDPALTVTHPNVYKNKFNKSQFPPRPPRQPDVRSPIYLLELSKYEANVVRILSDIESNSGHLLPDKPVQQIGQYLDHYNLEILATEDFKQVECTSRMIAENPILAFNMIWRFVYVLPKIRELLSPFSEIVYDEQAKEFISGNNTTTAWPTSSAIEDAMSGILRTQMVYDLDPDKLSSGIIYGVETGVLMSVYQMLAIGLFARDSKKYTLAVPWLELALNRLKEDQNNLKLYNISIEAVQTVLEEAINEHDAAVSTRPEWELFYYTDKLLIGGKPNPRRIPVRKSKLRKYRRRRGVTYNEINHWGLCSGENHQNEIEKSRLKCWYEASSDPALYINPVKMETLSKTPYIVQMYDVVTDSAGNELMELSRPHLRRSQVVNPEVVGETTYVSDVRTSVEHWVKEPFQSLHKFIEAITGLRANPPSAQPFLIASYAAGGQYECHLDAFEENNINYRTGNRIATLMFYLNDPQLGGFTAFPVAGIAARPIKGSAVFWYNLKRNGARDEDTFHCACPVAIGHKTISTKWILHNDQFQHRKCGLQEHE